jgi:hypothetical protein
VRGRGLVDRVDEHEARSEPEPIHGHGGSLGHAAAQRNFDSGSAIITPKRTATPILVTTDCMRPISSKV